MPSKIVVWFCLCFLISFAVAQESETFWTIAEPVARPENAPHYGDVVFSVRWNRSRSNLSHAADFHANRIEWSYIDDYEWIPEVREKGYFLSGSLNTAMADELKSKAGKKPTYEKGRIESKDGSIQGPEHLQAMGHRVGCFNNPQYRNLFVERAMALAQAGVNGIQVDGPTGSWGDVVGGRPVCYCKYCRELAKKRGDDIEEKQSRSLIARYGLNRTYKMAMEATREINPKIVWTKNVHKPLWFEEMFDYEFAELDPEDGIEPASFLELRKREGAADRFQIYTLRSGNVHLNRQTIALAYATGSLVSAPYDVYPADGYKTKERFYGKAFHYAGQYAFVRGCASLLNGFEDAFSVYEGKAADSRWGTPPIRVETASTDDEIALFARAKPGDPDAGLVVHVLHRRGGRECSGAVLNVESDALSQLGPNPRFTFHTATPYDKDAHAEVEAKALAIGKETGDLSDPRCEEVFRSLVATTRLGVGSEGESYRVILPDFSTHGILHIAPNRD